MRLWAMGQNEPVHTFKQDKPVVGAVFNRNESRILTWSHDGTARLLDISLDEKIPIDERILDLQVRSAASLYGSVELKLLSFDEWMTARMTARQTLNEMRALRAHSKRRIKERARCLRAFPAKSCHGSLQ